MNVMLFNVGLLKEIEDTRYARDPHGGFDILVCYTDTQHFGVCLVLYHNRRLVSTGVLRCFIFVFLFSIIPSALRDNRGITEMHQYLLLHVLQLIDIFVFLILDTIKLYQTQLVNFSSRILLAKLKRFLVGGVTSRDHGS